MPSLRFTIEMLISVCMLAAAVAGEASAQADPSGSLKLRFDQAVYQVGGCAELTLEASAHIDRPSLEVAVVHQNSRSSAINVPIIESANGLFRTARCFTLASSSSSAAGSAVLVKPGSTLAALAINSDGKPIAAALATVGGAEGADRFRPTIDPTVTGTSSSRNDIGAVMGDGAHVTSFLLKRVILRVERPSDLASFLARRHGKVIGTADHGGTRSSPTYHLIEVDTGTVDLDGFAALAERWTNAEGDLRFSSRDAMALVALVLEEQTIGQFVELDFLMRVDAVPRSEESGGQDFFGLPWSDPQASDSSPLPRIGEGVSLAHLLAKPAIVSPVPVAIVDLGFASPSDYVPPVIGNLDYGAPFNSIPQCSIDAAGFANCTPGSAAGPNSDEAVCPAPGDLCKWHGTAVFSAAAAVLNNSFGAAGTGSPVARPILINIAGNTFAAGSGISQALAPPNSPPARVINTSFGLSCMVLVLNICDPISNTVITTLSCTALLIAFPTLAFVPLPCPAIVALAAIASHVGFMESALASAWSNGAIVVSSAGNADVDVADAIQRPCVDDHTLCVSALNSLVAGGVTADPDVGHGSEVAAWAPSGTIVTPVPPDAMKLPVFSGTSNAAPIVSGALALVRAINPALTPDNVVALLRSANCSSASASRLGGPDCTPSSDPKVDARGYLDLLELVRRARLSANRPVLDPCTGGWDGPERAGQGDTPLTALPIPPLAPALHEEQMFEDSRDLSVHALLPARQFDQDWYSINFDPRQVPTPTGLGPAGFIIKVTVPVQDPSLGLLHVDIFRRLPNVQGPPFIPVLPLSKQDSSGGEAATLVVVRTDLDYFARVMAVSPASENSNCYAGVLVRVVEPAPLPPVLDLCVNLAGCR